jgi:DNA-binding transcriptional regulator YiaG
VSPDHPHSRGHAYILHDALRILRRAQMRGITRLMTIRRKVTTRKTWTAEEIKAFRHQLGLDQAELAKLLDVDIRTLLKWETPGGKRKRPAGAAIYMLNGLEEFVRRLSIQKARASLRLILLGDDGVQSGLHEVAGSILESVVKPIAALERLIFLGFQKVLENQGKSQK